MTLWINIYRLNKTFITGSSFETREAAEKYADHTRDYVCTSAVEVTEPGAETKEDGNA